MIRKSVSAILREKDPEVTAETFINSMLEDLKESTQHDEAAQQQDITTLNQSLQAAQQLITAIKSNF